MTVISVPKRLAISETLSRTKPTRGPCSMENGGMLLVSASAANEDVVAHKTAAAANAMTTWRIMAIALLLCSERQSADDLGPPWRVAKSARSSLLTPNGGGG